MKSRWLLFVCVAFYVQVNAQAGDDDSYKIKRFPSFIPSSPNASGLSKLADIQANGYSGTLNLDIPFYTLPLKKLSVPVSLSYNASGVKVNEYSSSTGMNWNLNAGGVITRIVRGKPDDQPDGYLWTLGFRGGSEKVGRIIDLYVRDSLTPAERLMVERGVADGSMDGQPDIYSYSFPGQSGKFIITPANKIIPIPYTPIRITGDFLNGFVITDTKGNTFEFKSVESTFSFSSVTNGETSQTTSPIDPDVTKNAWYLSRIFSAQQEEVTFQYTKDTINPVYQATQTQNYMAEPFPPSMCDAPSPFPLNYLITSTTTQQIGQLKLQTVQFPNGKITLSYLQGRTDLPGDSALTEVAIRRPDNSLIKKFNLTYAYYASRLFLTKVQENNGVDSIRPFLLNYNAPTSLPARTSFAQDHWGYYNGVTSNGTLIPVEQNKFSSYLATLPNTLGSADREPRANEMRYGMLSSITYPTGGYSVFYFEPNRYSKIGSESVVDSSFNYQTIVVHDSGNTIGTPVYSAPFTISYDQWVTVGYQIFGNQTSVKIVRMEGASEVVVFTISGNNTTPQIVSSHNVFLTAGTYKLRAFNYEEEFYARIHLHYQIINGYTVSYEKMGGGIRIRRVADYDRSANNIKNKFYYYKSSPTDTVSSGALLDKPTYSYFNWVIKPVACGQGNPNFSSFTGETGANYYIKMSVPTTALNTAAGSYVAYNAVMVQDDSLGGNGYTLQRFRSIDSTADQPFAGFLIPIASQRITCGVRPLKKRRSTVQEPPYRRKQLYSPKETMRSPTVWNGWHPG